MNPRGRIPLEWEDRYVPEPNSGCWLFLGAMSGPRRNYGIISGAKRKIFKAHRVSWERAYGPIPGGLWCLHKCDTPQCINPDHLFLGRARENTDDMVRKGRARKALNAPPKQLPANAKLNADLVREMRLAYKAGVKRRHLSARFGVSRELIYQVTHNIAWRWVTND